MIIPEITLSADVIIKLLQHYHPGSHNFVHFVEHGNHVIRIASMELESEICRYKGKRGEINDANYGLGPSSRNGGKF